MNEPRFHTRSQRGVTLIELIMAIVIVSVALTGVMQIVGFSITHSADPMIDRQALSIAEAYLEEILLKSFVDPGGGAESGRADFDNVDDYNGLSDVGAKDQQGSAIAALSAYTVNVTVTATALNGVPSADSRKVEVIVSHPSGINLSLVGYRTRY